MQEGHGTLTRQSQVELVQLEAANAGKGSEDIAADAAHRIGHHAAVREAAAVQAFAVNLVSRGYVVDEVQEKLHVIVKLARGRPTCG